MSRLSDYGIHVENLNNIGSVTIKGHALPIAFTMETMEYVADIYDNDYAAFERDSSDMLRRANGEFTSSTLSASDLKIMRTLIYAMLRTGGLEDSPQEIFTALGMGQDVLRAYSECMQIFARQNFQEVDLKKSQKPQDLKNSKTLQKNVRRKNRKKKR